MQEQLFESIQNSAFMAEYFAVVKGMDAKFGVDGNQFYYITGNLPEPDCIVGFGDTPYEALANYYLEFRSMKIKTTLPKQV